MSFVEKRDSKSICQIGGAHQPPNHVHAVRYSSLLSPTCRSLHGNSRPDNETSTPACSQHKVTATCSSLYVRFVRICLLKVCILRTVKHGYQQASCRIEPRLSLRHVAIPHSFQSLFRSVTAASTGMRGQLLHLNK